ncbi:GNAT family N-acetyltransferase [Photobacterium rosenbergii]|uniref:GNAT family N-acetyltransferase n=1 Tax=Photobacterium rosenbergii TaxID=294936 RepID=A0A2T3NKR6_9GAMM|nr:GNAT family N-acetyltransferase [Photobacterium rosenbergii]PSW16115.1 GNAT family N-acetyltransferase [Photobacterium rosenbergii]
MISYQPSTNLSQSAEMTYQNMCPYYEQLSVSWEPSKILEQVQGLDNWDILYEGEVIGAIRMSFDSEGGYLRDLQISGAFQNKGLGAKALDEAMRLTKQAGAKKLRLRVFKISPAFHLYERCGFSVVSDDEKFIYMEKLV